MDWRLYARSKRALTGETLQKMRILFICTGNSCRSQIAEGYARHLRGDTWDAWSAGTEPRELDQYAVRVMAEE